MNTFAVIILVCSTALSRPACQEETALMKIRGPDVANELMCGRNGQAFLAELSLKVTEKEWVKIKCIRTSIGRGNVG